MIVVKEIKEGSAFLMLEELLKDRTTGGNIIWGTDSYSYLGDGYQATDEMLQRELIFKDLVKSRMLRDNSEQAARTKKKAEVFTPAWICNKMNNYCDEEWFGRKDVFNVEIDKSWKVNDDLISFPNGKTWKDYVLSTRLEITCGEAPFICSRYDAVAGKEIEVNKRIGFLDRKLRVINENVNNINEWMKWVTKAYQATYGFEFQGDNLLLARINLLLTFEDNMIYKWNEQPTKSQLKKIANIITWNIWQMDGLTGTIPFSKSPKKYEIMK